MEKLVDHHFGYLSKMASRSFLLHIRKKREVLINVREFKKCLHEKCYLPTILCMFVELEAHRFFFDWFRKTRTKQKKVFEELKHAPNFNRK